ncbi:JmjC domain [Trichophyton interdigitale]|nr:JmjC domain [Trichophyton interdigitale]
MGWQASSRGERGASLIICRCCWLAAAGLLLLLLLVRRPEPLLLLLGAAAGAGAWLYRLHRVLIVGSWLRCVAPLSSPSFAAAMAGAAALRYLALDTLATDCVAAFRESCFKAQRPVVLPRGLFRNYRAVSRWFDPPPPPLAGAGAGAAVAGAACSAPASNPGLNYAYLERHGDCYVPLELTIPGGRDGVVFERAHRPLSLFLQWTRSVQSTPAAEAQDGPRLYLAQCQLLDLPGSLREDFPTPSYVMQAGKGDIYDTNIWVGLAPTYTPLHRDPNPNLFVQLAGSKHVRLLAPDVGRGVFAQRR